MEHLKGDGFLRAVKIFNVVAGILLVVGTATLVGALIIRASGDDEPEATPVQQMDAGHKALQLPAPAGSRIVESHVDGNTVLLILETAEAAQIAIAVELKSGRITTLTPGEADQP